MSEESVDSESSEILEISDETSSSESEIPEVQFPWRWENVKHHPVLFRSTFKFSVRQFNDILWPEIEDLFPREHPNGGSKWKLCPRSTGLLVLAFLRKGIPYSDVAEHFGLSEARARIIIQQTLPKMLNHLDYFVAWRSWVEQESHLPEAEGRHFSNCVCIVDATEHECNRPTVNQRNFYSGKSKTHCVKFQISIEHRW